MENKNSMYRNLFISSTINADTISGVIKEILLINNDDDIKEEEYANFEREPIKLYINSHGGNVYDGLALVDIIKRSKTPVHTICIGSCMSMGLWIWLSGVRRFIGENATLMFHDITCWVCDKSETLKQELAETLRQQEMLVQEITSRSLVKEETIVDYITRKAEWYIPSYTAIELKLADEYYK